MSLLPARMRMIDSKMKELECSQDFSHYKSLGIFPDAQGQLTPHSLVRSGRNFELVRDVMDVLVTCKYEEDPIKNEGARVVTIFSPIITLWELSVAMDTRVPIRSSPKPNAWPFPHPNNGSIKILLRLTHWLQRYSTLKMSTDTQTDTQTDDGSTGIL